MIWLVTKPPGQAIKKSRLQFKFAVALSHLIGAIIILTQRNGLYHQVIKRLACLVVCDFNCYLINKGV